MTSTANNQYTILRIKRKRNEEPLDALVVDASATSRRKKVRLRGGLEVFQFAQTIEPAAWDDERERLELQDQISKLAAGPEASASQPIFEGMGAPKRSSVDGIIGRRYKVMPQQVQSEIDAENHSRGIPATNPPKVISSVNVPPRSLTGPGNFLVFDAIRDEAQANKQDEDEISRFLPMLQEYLSLHEERAVNLVKKSSTTSINDYVYDVFYHRPTTLSDWNNSNTNIATLTGLPLSITSQSDSDSDSEVDDEADEDSNAEEYYKNDYPDESESDSDSDRRHDSDEFSNDEE